MVMCSWITGMCAIMYLEIPPDPHNGMDIFMLGITTLQ